MLQSFNIRKKIVALWSLFSLLLNIAQPAFVALTLAPVIIPSSVQAEDATDSAATINPTPTSAPSAELTAAPSTSPIESIIPSPEPTIEPSLSPTPSPDATIEPVASIEPSIAPSMSPSIAPTAIPSTPTPSQDSSPAPPSPTATPSPNLDEQLNIAIIDNTAATSIEEFDLTVTETGSATLSTDKVDYAPTDTALITGAGFLTNTTYSLTISSTDDPATSTTVEVTTDADGTLFYAYQLDGLYRPNYQVEAYLASTLVATTTFTDAPVGSTEVIDGDLEGRKPNGDWVNGNVCQSGGDCYKEGDEVKHRLKDVDRLTVGNTYWFLVDHDYQCTNGTLGYTEFNDAVGISGASNVTLTYRNDISTSSNYVWEIVFTATAVNDIEIQWNALLSDEAGSCNGSQLHVTYVSGGAESIPIPVREIIELPDITVTKMIDRDGNGTFESATANEYTFTLDGTTTLNTNASGQVIFTNVTPDGPHTITEDQLDFSLGSYSFASGTGTNCTFGTGGTATATITAGSTPTNASCTFNNQLSTGTLRLIKTVITDNGGNATASDFNLHVKSAGVDITGRGSATGTVYTLASGTYTVSEDTPPTGYTQTGVVCDGQNTNSVTVIAGQEKVCTITNSDLPGHLIVHKVTYPTDTVTIFPLNIFIRTGGIEGDKSRTILSGTPLDITVKAGTYSVGEALTTGWSTTGNDCNDIDVGIGETKECTITNTKLGSIAGFKFNDLNGNGFRDSGEPTLANWFISITSSPYGTQTTQTGSDGSYLFGNLLPTTYSFSEGSITGWTPTLTPPSVDLAAGVASTANNFGNQMRGSITIIKDALPDTAEDFSFDSPNQLGAFSLDDDQDNTLANAKVFSDLGSNSYLVSENAHPGWSLTDITCEGDDNAQIDLANHRVTLNLDRPAENITCTFANVRDTGTITITKDTIPNHSKNFTFTTTGGTLPTSFQLDDDASSPLPRTRTFTVPTGPYSITEPIVSSWELTDLSCTDDNGNWNLSTAQANLSVEIGENITCTFTNTKYGSIAGRKYHDLNGSGTKQTTEPYLGGWTIDLLDANLQLLDSVVTGTGSLEDGQYKFANLLPGTYYTCERLQSGWVQTDPTSGTQYNSTYCRERTLTAGQNITGVHFGNRGALSITACKWEDSNGQSEGGNFSPISGWDMTLGDTTQTTGENGCTTFSNLIPGDYSVSEGATKGWSSADGQTTQRTTLTDSDETLDFYNYHPGSISGSKWDDLDGDGSWDDEPPIANWHIQLFASDDEDKGDQIGEDTLTNSDGNYSFAEVEPGDYYVCEVEQDGWTQTYPNFDSEYGQCHSVTVNSGDQLTGFDFGNFRYGQIQGFKYEDKNGNGTRDKDENFLNGWEICLNNESWEGKECTNTYSSEAYGDGYFSFGGLEYGGYTLTEDETDSSYQRTEPESSSYSIPVQSGTGYGEGENFYYFGNAPLTNIHGYKWDDVNGNGRRDCTLFDEFSRFDQTCEDLLGNWTIFLDENGNEILDESEESTTTDSNSESEDFGWYQFNNLLPGSYTICEVEQGGWRQTYPLGEATACHQITVPNDDEQTENGTVGPEYHFGNQVEPTLRIQKFNNAVGNKNPGDTVTFTIIVDLAGSAINNVIVTDVTPDGFGYVSSSWSSSKLGVLEPNYASPGTWNLGDMEPGDVITLTYQTKISADQDGGSYNDIAWAEGNSPAWENILALGHTSEYVDGIFVGTDVVVNKNTEQTGTVNIEREGEVLGASTSLPATGASVIWLILALGSLISGLFLIFRGKSMKFLTVLLLTSFIHLSYPVTSAMAIENIAVRLEQPTSPTRLSEWRLSYAVLDRLERTPNVTCYVKKPGSSSFTQFDIIHPSSKPSGDNGNCHINSSIMSGQGTYDFKVVASTTTGLAESKESTVISVSFDTDGPGAPTNYSKEHPSSCRWIIKFHTASDSGLTTKVEIYSSDQKSFDTNPSTRVGTVSLGSDQNGEYIHDRASDCDKEWYYVIRAFDSVGNQSGHIGDSVVKISTISTPTSSSLPALIVTSTNNGSVLGKAEEVSELGEVMGQTSTPSPESVEGEGLVSGAQDALKTATSDPRKWWIIAIIIAILGSYVYIKKHQKP